MKHLITAHTVFVFFLLTSTIGYSQSSIGVVSMPGFPAMPSDTAFEGQLYTFDVVVSNTATGSVQGPLALNMKIDSITTILDTITNPILGGGTVTKTIADYNFSQPLFKTGNNIVVVWPSINNSTIQVDTFYTNVYFVPLLSNIEYPLQDPLMVYPNPVSDFLKVQVPDETILKEYLLLDDLGRIMQSSRMYNNMIDLRNVPSGVYFLRLVGESDEWSVKLIKD